MLHAHGNSESHGKKMSIKEAILIERLQELKDYDLLWVFHQVMENRKFEYEEAVDQHQQPTPTATLAIIKKLVT